MNLRFLTRFFFLVFFFVVFFFLLFFCCSCAICGLCAGGRCAPAFFFLLGLVWFVLNIVLCICPHICFAWKERSTGSIYRHMQRGTRNSRKKSECFEYIWRINKGLFFFHVHLNWLKMKVDKLRHGGAISHQHSTVVRVACPTDIYIYIYIGIGSDQQTSSIFHAIFAFALITWMIDCTIRWTRTPVTSTACIRICYSTIPSSCSSRI